MMKSELKKMSNEELVGMYQKATGVDKEDILDILLQKIEGIMVLVSNSYINIPNIDDIDRLGELRITFLKLLDKFDITKGYKLTTFSRACFRQRMNKLYKYQTTKKRFDDDIQFASLDVLQDMKKDGNDGKKSKGGDSEMALEVTPIEDVDFREMLKSLDLTEKERMTCILISEEKMSKSDVARALKVSPATVRFYLDKVGAKIMRTQAYSF